MGERLFGLGLMGFVEAILLIPFRPEWQPFYESSSIQLDPGTLPSFVEISAAVNVASPPGIGAFLRQARDKESPSHFARIRLHPLRVIRLRLLSAGG